MIATIDPATGETLARFDAHSPAEIDARLERAARAQAAWRWQPAEERAALLPASPRCSAPRRKRSPR